MVDRAGRRVRLDPQVRAGARLAYDGEAVLLHTTSLGHCGETADYLARVLRRSGWDVTVDPVDEQPVLISACFIGPAMMPDAAASALVAQIVGTGAVARQPAAERLPLAPPNPRVPGATASSASSVGTSPEGTTTSIATAATGDTRTSGGCPRTTRWPCKPKVRLAWEQECAPEDQEAPSGLAE